MPSKTDLTPNYQDSLEGHMKFLPFIFTLMTSLSFLKPVMAGVYKCTDNQGNTSYQSAPCSNENKAIEIDIKSGSMKDLSVELQNKELEQQLLKQQEAENIKKLEIEAKRKQDSIKQSKLNQELIKNNPIQYSAFAIPPYSYDNLPELVKRYQTRLPEIEKFRRMAALKALATGECRRVESDELSIKSKSDQLVFSVDCSSAKTFFFNEFELLN